MTFGLVLNSSYAWSQCLEDMDRVVDTAPLKNHRDSDISALKKASSKMIQNLSEYEQGERPLESLSSDEMRLYLGILGPSYVGTSEKQKKQRSPSGLTFKPQYRVVADHVDPQIQQSFKPFFSRFIPQPEKSKPEEE
jgi:hypothetical protein